MRNIVRLAATAFAVAAVPATAWAIHNRLVKSTPLNGDELGESPKTITLWFAEKPETPLSAITLQRADSQQVKLGALTEVKTEKNAIAATIAEGLKSGVYTVSWKAASSDGHPVKGKYSFTVK